MRPTQAIEMFTPPVETGEVTSHRQRQPPVIELANKLRVEPKSTRKVRSSGCCCRQIGNHC